MVGMEPVEKADDGLRKYLKITNAQAPSLRNYDLIGLGWGPNISIFFKTAQII